jgi:hypothetical protein
MAAQPPALPLNHDTRFASRWSMNRVLKNKYQAVSQGVRRFGKRSIFENM